MRKLALVVEEDNIVRSLVTHVLNICDFEVLHAEKQTTAIELFSQYEQEISYVYIDYNLRCGNGLNLYRSIRNRNSSVFILLSSGLPDNGLLTLNQDPHGQFLLKPFSLDSFMETIKKNILFNEQVKTTFSNQILISALI